MAPITRRALFREVNTRIGAINDLFDDFLLSFQLLCECGTDGCVERMEVPKRVFDDVASKPAHYLVAPGHELLAPVVETNGSYQIVAVAA